MPTKGAMTRRWCWLGLALGSCLAASAVMALPPAPEGGNQQNSCKKRAQVIVFVSDNAGNPYVIPEELVRVSRGNEHPEHGPDRVRFINTLSVDVTFWVLAKEAVFEEGNDVQVPAGKDVCRKVVGTGPTDVTYNTVYEFTQTAAGAATAATGSGAGAEGAPDPVLAGGPGAKTKGGPGMQVDN